MALPELEEVEALLAANRKSMRWLSRELGMTHQGVINILSRKTKSPRNPLFESELSRALDSLREVSRPLFPVGLPEAPIPLWPWLPAGEWCRPEESVDWFELPHFLNRPKRIVTQVLGTSMEPFIREGDFLLFQLDPNPRYGRVVIAKNEHGEATVKVLRRKADGSPTLEPINPSHSNPEFNSLSCIGYLVAILRNYASGRGEIIWDEGGLTP